MRPIDIPSVSDDERNEAALRGELPDETPGPRRGRTCQRAACPDAVLGRTHMAPLCVNRCRSRLANAAPVLAGVKQTALDAGCGSAPVEGVGNGLKNGSGGQLRLA